jgi:hypothetical protein
MKTAHTSFKGRIVLINEVGVLVERARQRHSKK